MTISKENLCEEITIADCTPGTVANSLNRELKTKLQNAPGFVPNYLETALMNEYNPSLLGCARMLKENGFNEQETIAVLYATPGHRAPDGDEIEKAVAVVFNTAPKTDSIKWPEPSRDAIDRIADESTVRSVKALQSKFPMEGDGTTLDVLKRLYEQGERIAYAEHKKAKAKSELLANIPDLEGMQMICPNPRTKEWGLKRDGKKSRRAVGNDPKQRRFAVVEFDKVNGEKLPHGTQAAIAWHSSKIAPLALVVNSGGKSLHCWFDCRDLSEDELSRFMKYAVSLGADKEMWKKSQWCRMPGGERVNDDGTTAPQTVLVCRPEAAKADEWHLDKLPCKSRFGITNAANIPFSLIGNYLIKGIIDRKTVSAIYGLPGSAKSFCALSMSSAIANGREWHGCRVKQGAVLYITLEGRAGFRKRIHALRQKGEISESVPFYIIEKPFHVVESEHVEIIIEEIKALEESEKINFEFIVIYTLARSMSDAEEDTKGMQRAADGAERIQTAIGSHVQLVHHSGKDESKGMRGGISLKGAIDTVIKSTKSKIGVRQFELSFDKQKDGDDTARFRFELDVVELGEDEDGDPVTTCTVKFLEMPVGVDFDSENEKALKLLPQDSKTAWANAIVESGICDDKKKAENFINRKLKGKYRTIDNGKGKPKRVERIEDFADESL